MITLMASLVWLLACLSYVSAVPIETFAGNNTSIARRDTANALQYPYSLQLVLTVLPVRTYSWRIYQGPQGVAVDPCQIHNPFKRVYMGPPFSDSDDAISHPPFPNIYVNAPIEYSNFNDYEYVGTGTDAGQFQCGDHYIIDCAKDPRYDEATFKCGPSDLREFHRGYYCEF